MPESDRQTSGALLQIMSLVSDERDEVGLSCSSVPAQNNSYSSPSSCGTSSFYCRMKESVVGLLAYDPKSVNMIIT